MNQVICIGRLTKDIELRYSQNQTAIARFSLAIDRGKDKSGEKLGTDFPNFIAFGKTAEALEKWTRKGSRVAVSGRLQTGSYDDKEGRKVYTTDIVVDRIEIIDFKNQSSEGAGTDAGVYDGFHAYDDEDDSDIPF